MNDAVDPALRRRAVDAARGVGPFDLLITGGSVVDVGTCEVRPADVGLVGPLIASVHPSGSRTDALDAFDATGRFIAPGLIDMHVHFESSMLTPGAYASAVCPRGTTTIFGDPHELANVAGVAGVRYAVEASRGLPVRFIVQAPSCVPPMPGLELSGADLHGPEVAEMLAWPEVGGLAEVMDMLGVLTSDGRMVDVVAAGLASGKLVSGHAAGLTGAELQAYLAAGITSDHEIVTQDDAMEKLRAGLTVELRGAFEHLLPGLVAELNALPELPTHLCAATDDLFALTLLTDGGIDHLLRRLVGYGLAPVRALRIATYHAAYRLRRTDLGLVAAGRQADLIILSDLATVAVDEVFAAGQHVASGGEMVVPVVEGPSVPPLDTMKIDPLTPDHFVLRVGHLPGGVYNGTTRLRVLAGPVFTTWGEVDAKVRDGVVVPPDGHMLQVAVHRHGRIAPRPQAALVSGWGEWTGAVATSVSHDTHNLVVFGRDPVDMAAAANQVIADGGGVAVASGGKVVARVALPIAGLLSPLPAAEVAEAQRAVQDAAAAVGLTLRILTQPLFTVMVASLACLPGPHVTDLGLIDGTTGERIASPLLTSGG
ncbi:MULTISPECIES: adenine deaminase [unclassified Pseudofrankia]|uniref:adenine deaminase n=1 Tax=unclassified Pseudofrankia TaxID=2994372 RepID=UPI0008D92B41|nr:MULTISPECIES: adenine deaminase C-terminal domain-containing protein [unclassified Pseudofrankia]MDT3438800.1 adenine deaminase C-terminal domain-containing protein [Pseudofrankia sp. BMG5.37]OHV75185.1 adenosine deaminase [Pseudofrankia sp. BMG5.36]